MSSVTPATNVYIAASTNRQPHAAVSNNESLIAFGTSTCIALWNAAAVRDEGIHQTLPGHNGSITCVRFIRNDLLVSGDDKGILQCWKRTGEKWGSIVTQQAHKEAISALVVYENLLASGASDSLVKIWKFESDGDSGSLAEIQSIPLKMRYPLSLAISSLPESQALILAIGSTDRNIQIWTCSEDTFVPSVTLSGHEDWVKTLSFSPLTPTDRSLVLASGSQDSTIRLWNIEPYVKGRGSDGEVAISNELTDDLLDAFEASLGDLADAEEGGRQISLKRHIITVKSSGGSQQQFILTFDALLVGHEAGVTSLSWRPLSSDYSEPTLLSTSTDSSLILWSPSTILGSSQSGTTSLWINRQRFGDVGGQRLGGFVGGLWTRGGREALAWGWSGGWRRWRCTTKDGTEIWKEVGAISGHGAPVRGLNWSPNGEYLISASQDQTTRIHAETRYGDEAALSWHEIGRPQVHGYDLNDAAFIEPLRFVSIADEKVARVFEGPREFVETVKNLGVAETTDKMLERPRAAAVPPLGLSNKAVSDVSQATDVSAYDTDRMKRPPFEGELAAITLWPEVEKVFGHGYESISLAVSTHKKLAATACKATSPEHALVRVYDTEKWQPVGSPLAGHTLSVTRITFSPDDRFILSVSRDRTWRLFQRQDADQGFVPFASDKSHARIIWDCAWAHEGDIFATASRDKTVKIWKMRLDGAGQKWTPEKTIKVPEAATAVAFAAEDASHKRRLAVGLESGEIIIYSNNRNTLEDWREDILIPKDLAHVGQIHRLEWRPGSEENKQLASCSEDGTLKVLAVPSRSE